MLTAMVYPWKSLMYTSEYYYGTVLTWRIWGRDNITSNSGQNRHHGSNVTRLGVMPWYMMIYDLTYSGLIVTGAGKETIKNATWWSGNYANLISSSSCRSGVLNTSNVIIWQIAKVAQVDHIPSYPHHLPLVWRAGWPAWVTVHTTQSRLFYSSQLLHSYAIYLGKILRLIHFIKNTVSPEDICSGGWDVDIQQKSRAQGKVPKHKEICYLLDALFSGCYLDYIT